MTSSALLLETIAARWGAPDAVGDTPLLIDGVRVGKVRISAGLPDCV